MTPLEKQIADRQAFIEKVITFTHSLLNAKGTVLHHEEFSGHCNTKRELVLGDFKFYDDGSFTMFGGDNVTIHYKGFKVFDVDYWDIEKAKVTTFDTNMPCPDWQTPLKKLMRTGVTRTVSKLDKEKSKATKKATNLMQAVKHDMDVHEEAARLLLL